MQISLCVKRNNGRNEYEITIQADNRESLELAVLGSTRVNTRVI